MHYGSDFFSKDGQDTITPTDPNVTIGQRDGLSQGDIAAIHVMYPPGIVSGKFLVDAKNRKDSTREEKEDKEGEDFEEKKKKGRKDFKDKDKDGDKPKDGVGEELKDPAHGGSAANATANKNIADRLAGLQQTVAGLAHFIAADWRPDLSTSSLSYEQTTLVADAATLSAPLAKQARDAKAAKDAKDAEKQPDR
jgi:hypothetical protein